MQVSFFTMHNFKRMAGRADRLLVRLCLSRPDAVARLARPRWVDDQLPVQVPILVLVEGEGESTPAAQGDPVRGGS